MTCLGKKKKKTSMFTLTVQFEKANLSRVIKSMRNKKRAL